MDKGKGKMEEVKEKEEQRKNNNCNSSATGIRIRSNEEEARKEDDEAESAMDMTSLGYAVPTQEGILREPIKVLILGYKGVGKTTLIQSHNVQPSDGNLNEYVIDFKTDGDGRCLRFVCSESANREIAEDWKYNAFVLLFDLTHRFSYTYMHNMCKDFASNRKSDKRPIVLVGNKSDSKNIIVKDIAAGREFGLPLYLISAKEKVDTHKPFLSIARSMMKVPGLVFVDDLPPIPIQAPTMEKASTVLFPEITSAESSQPVAKPLVVKASPVLFPEITSAESSQPVAEPLVVKASPVLLPTRTISSQPLAKPTLRIRRDDDDDDDRYDFLQGQSSQSQCCYL